MLHGGYRSLLVDGPLRKKTRSLSFSFPSIFFVPSLSWQMRSFCREKVCDLKGVFGF
jgi:hypothetical protein